MMKVLKRRALEAMPFDKTFEVDGRQVSCHATGFEVMFDDDDVPGWWNEFYNPETDDMEYGR